VAAVIEINALTATSGATTKRSRRSRASSHGIRRLGVVYALVQFVLTS